MTYLYRQRHSSHFLKEIRLRSGGGTTFSSWSSILSGALIWLVYFCSKGNYQGFKGKQQVGLNPASTCWPSVCLLWKNVSSVLLSFKLSYFGFCCWVLGVLYIVGMLVPHQIRDWRIVSHSVCCLFILLMVSIPEQKLFSLIASHLFIFREGGVAFFWVSKPKNHCHVRYHGAYYCFF